MSLLAVEGPTRAIEHSVDLARHDEIVLVQSHDFLGAQRDGRVTPAEADVGVMAFGLSEFTDLLDKGPCFTKVAEPEGPLDTMSVVAEKSRELWHAVALLGWVLFSRWVDVGLSWSGTDLHGFSSLTVAWIAYALALLCLGFWMNIKELRFWSLGIMFVTVTKILLASRAKNIIVCEPP